jgi:hypothetical protein
LYSCMQYSGISWSLFSTFSSKSGFEPIKFTHPQLMEHNKQLQYLFCATKMWC